MKKEQYVLSTLNRNLALFRKEIGWSQDTLAARLGIKRSRYSQYEVSKIEPSIGLIVSIAQLYHTSVEVLWNEPLNRPEVCKILKIEE